PAPTSPLFPSTTLFRSRVCPVSARPPPSSALPAPSSVLVTKKPSSNSMRPTSAASTLSARESKVLLRRKLRYRRDGTRLSFWMRSEEHTSELQSRENLV